MYSSLFLKKKIKHNFIKQENTRFFYKKSEFLFNSLFLAQFIRICMRHGKYSKMEKAFYTILGDLKWIFKKHPLLLLLYIHKIYRPTIFLASFKKGAQTLHVPKNLALSKQDNNLQKFIFNGSHSRLENSFYERLFSEIFYLLLDENHSKTTIILKKLYNDAYENRVYMHFRWTKKNKQNRKK